MGRTPEDAGSFLGSALPARAYIGSLRETPVTFAYWTILVAALLPYVTVGLAKGGRSGYDNATPRAWAERLAGWKRRAEWAHRNHFEAFGPFAAAVIVANLAHAAPGRIDLLAGLFIVCRVAYTLAYLADRPTLRSVLWMCGIACVIALFVAGA
jgi:uncharacterized MAPEG superfamily protein